MDTCLCHFILESTPHCVFVIDEDFRLVYGNKNFLRFAEESYDRTFKEGDELLKLLPRNRQLRWQLHLKEVFSGQCTRLEEAVEIKGKIRYFDVCYQPLYEGDDFDKIVVFFEEITTRKRREISLQERERELEETLASRQTLLSVISHDLRSPIFQLNGLLFLIQQDVDKLDKARIEMHAQDLEQRLSHLTHTLDNVLSWTALQQTDLEPRITRFSLKEVVDTAAGLLKPVSDQKSVSVTYNDLSGIWVNSDREMTAFVVRNLLNNAIKFSKQAGKVELKAKCSEDFVEIEVRDSGVGFDPGRLSTADNNKVLFTKAGTWGEQGTGLGLRLCYDFIARLRGQLNISSDQGHGTRVTVILPQELFD